MLPKIVRPDAKGRITLGQELTRNVSGYTLTETKDHKLLLEPRVEILAHEKWLFESEVALEKIKRGLKDAAEGRVSSKGSFSEFINDDIE